MKTTTSIQPRSTARFRSTAWVAASALACTAALLASCAVPRAEPEADPTANFVAHSESGGLMIDRNLDGRRVLVTDGSGGLFSDGPQLVARSGDTTLAAFWVKDTGHLSIRHSTDRSAPVVGRVRTTWDGGLLRLVLETSDGRKYATSRFRRIDLQREPEALGQGDESLLDVAGIYQAVFRDDAGRPLGWLRVRIDPSRQFVHVYEGDVPPSLDPSLLTGATALLEADVSDLEGHAENPYIGDAGRR